MGVTLLIALAAGCTGRHEGKCTVINGTEGNAAVVVMIYGRRYALEDLPPGKSFEFAFDVTHETSYSVEVRLGSGRSYREDVYVAAGIDCNDVLWLGNGGVRVEPVRGTSQGARQE